MSKNDFVVSLVSLLGVSGCAIIVVADVSEPANIEMETAFEVIPLPGSDGVGAGVSFFRVRGEHVAGLAFAQAQTSSNLFYEVAPDGFYVPLNEMPYSAEESTSDICFGDGDGDGVLEFITANQHGEDNHLFQMGQADPVLTIPGGDNYHCVWADIDGDGLHEGFLFDVAGQSVVIELEGNGFGVLPPSSRFPWTQDGLPAGGGSFADVDLDGDPDLIVTSPVGVDRLYINTGGHFQEHSAGGCDLGAEAGMSAGASLGDLDADGDADLFIARLDGADRLFRNEGGCFTRIDSPALAQETFQSWSAVWFDPDGDGDLDLAVAQYNGAILVYENSGGELRVVQRISEFNHVTAESRASGLAVFDADGDHDPDLMAAIWDGFPNIFIRNNLNHTVSGVSISAWTQNGAPLFGSQIHASAKGQLFYRELSANEGLRSQSDPLIHLPIQPADIDWLEVRYFGEVIYRSERHNIEPVVEVSFVALE